MTNKPAGKSGAIFTAGGVPVTLFPPGSLRYDGHQRVGDDVNFRFSFKGTWDGPPYYLLGFFAGSNGQPRDWSEPDGWHRGYLHGRLEAMKQRRIG
jgi:hypothetical protein